VTGDWPSAATAGPTAEWRASPRGLLALGHPGRLTADPGYPVTVEVQNVSVRIGERALIVATITILNGYKVTDSYGHRLSGLSADDGIELEQRLVRGAVRHDQIVFLVPVRATRAGTDTVSGMFRFSYHDGRELDILAARFEATVTGVE
jgi:hypothetical protein